MHSTLSTFYLVSYLILISKRATGDKVSIDDLKDGYSVSEKLKSSILEKTLSSMELPSQYTHDTPKSLVIGSVLGRFGTKTPTVPTQNKIPASKRKSWYSISSKKSEDCNPSAIDQVSFCNHTKIHKDRKTTSSRSTKQSQDSTPNNPITIIVTSPSSDINTQEDNVSISSTSSHSSVSSQFTSSFDTSRLMPPFPSIPQKYDIPKSNEAPEVKKWLIGCMNRKADTLPRKLIFRMMEIYGIKEEELDPRMWGKLQEGVVDEGVVLNVDVEDKHEGDVDGDCERKKGEEKKKKDESNGVDALRSLRTSYLCRKKGEGKDVSAHPNNTANLRSSKSNNYTTTNTKQQSPHSTIPTTNPRVWQKSSSRARNWPTTVPNLHHGAAFSFPPHTNTYTYAHVKSKHGVHGKNNGYAKNSMKRGIYPPSSKRGSTISLRSIPEHEVFVGAVVDVKGSGERGVKVRRGSASVERRKR